MSWLSKLKNCGVMMHSSYFNSQEPPKSHPRATWTNNDQSHLCLLQECLSANAKVTARQRNPAVTEDPLPTFVSFRRRKSDSAMRNSVPRLWLDSLARLKKKKCNYRVSQSSQSEISDSWRWAESFAIHSPWAFSSIWSFDPLILG